MLVHKNMKKKINIKYNQTFEVTTQYSYANEF